MNNDIVNFGPDTQFRAETLENGSINLIADKPTMTLTIDAGSPVVEVKDVTQDEHAALSIEQIASLDTSVTAPDN